MSESIFVRFQDAHALGEVVQHGRRLLHQVAVLDGKGAGRDTAGSCLRGRSHIEKQLLLVKSDKLVDW